MGREIEIKVPLTDSQYDSIFDFMMGKGKFEELSLVKPCDGNLIVKQDEYYSRYKTRAERIENNEPQVIRIRTDEVCGQKKSYFTLKRKSKQNGIELNKEDETFVEDVSVIRQMLELAGYDCWFKKEKRNYGVHCNFNGMSGTDFHLELETVNDMKYVEIEVTSEEGDADKIKTALNDFVSCLGLDPEKRDIRSWVEIITGSKPE